MLMVALVMKMNEVESFPIYGTLVSGNPARMENLNPDY